jgi:hypothetical protein
MTETPDFWPGLMWGLGLAVVLWTIGLAAAAAVGVVVG